MPKFKPKYHITNSLAKQLMQLEGLKTRIDGLPITPRLLAHLRETAKLQTTHYSTMIEGNRLSQKDVEGVLRQNHHFPGRERDEREVKNYYGALDFVEQLAEQNLPVTERQIQLIHGHVMQSGKGKPTPTPYRDGQNVIKDSHTGGIVYMPPEAKDVPELMGALADWIEEDIPCPIKAALAHYQFATIHPYYDGNGRTARLMATMILHLGGYGLKGIYSLEEYYAQNLQAYYDAIAVGPSHNYYMGRADADLTGWVEYFIAGMIESFTKVEAQAKSEAASLAPDNSAILRKLDPRQRKALTLFEKQETVTSADIATLFGFAPRTARLLLENWVKAGFLEIADPSKKSRKYRLSSPFAKLFS